VSFAGVLLDKSSLPPRTFFWHFPHYTNQGGRPGGAVRDGDWKFIEHYEEDRFELFDLALDPGEATDLSRREPDRVGKLRAQLAAWRVSVAAQTNQINPNFDSAAHRPLYVDLDMSRFDPKNSSADEMQRAQTWRRLMNEPGGR
jgi:hypothetical protein